MYDLFRGTIWLFMFVLDSELADVGVGFRGGHLNLNLNLDIVHINKLYDIQ